MLVRNARDIFYKRLFKSGFQNVLQQESRMVSSHSNASIKDDLEIGANLFENSSQKHEPVKLTDAFKTQQRSKDHIKAKAREHNNKRLFVQKEEKVIYDAELGLEFYRDSKYLANILTLARSQKQRDKNRKIIVEGKRLISEAIKCKLRMSALVFSQKDQLLEIKDEITNAQKLCAESKIYKISQHELKMWSSLTTPPGILAIFDKPSESYTLQENIKSKPLPITVVCDNIREPNNLGSIIRSCAALPCAQLLITKGCCDPWNSKVLRGGCGGHFRLLIRDDVCWPDLDKWIPLECRNDYRVFIAENNVGKALQETKENPLNYKDVSILGRHNVIVIGGETSGVSPEAYKFLETCGRGKCLFIPLADGIESLNVASALTLILYEFRNRLIEIQANEQMSQ